MKRTLFARTLLFSMLTSALLSFTACKTDEDKTDEDKCKEGDLVACVKAAVKDVDKRAVNATSGIKESKDVGNENSSAGILVDKRDGKKYKTVKIGNQTWMAENLNFKTDSSFCNNCAKYGRFYSWAAAVGKSESECGFLNTCSLPSGNIQGVCPEGWHLPSKTEWETLFNAVGGQSIAGKKIKSSSGWYGGGNGTDSFGFSALPAGYRGDFGNFNYEDLHANFWSSTEDGSFDAYRMYLGYDGGNADLSSCIKNYGFSVRCIQDK